MADKHGYLNAESHDRLRRCAKDLIDSGVPPRHRGGHLGVDALQLLYERASNPESAADALKLLHELQTYQVELDLLHEQLQANEYELSEELIHFKSLYERAPAAFLVLANDGEIIEGNLAAGKLFGKPAMELTGIALSALLAPGQKAAMNRLLHRAEGHHTATGSLELTDQRSLSVSVNSAATGDSILMILTDTQTHSATP